MFEDIIERLPTKIRLPLIAEVAQTGVEVNMLLVSLDWSVGGVEGQIEENGVLGVIIRIDHIHSALADNISGVNYRLANINEV